MTNNLINYNIINYKQIMCKNIQGDLQLYVSIQILLTTIFYTLYCFYIFNFLYSKTFFNRKPKLNNKISMHYTNNTNNIFFKLIKKYKFDMLFYNTLWNLINIYSYIYIYVKKNPILIYIYNNGFIIKNNLNYFVNHKINYKSTIDIIYKGDIILILNNESNINDMKNVLNLKLNNIQYDFILYKHNEIESYKIINNSDIKYENVFMLEKSNIRFFAVCIQVYNNYFEYEKYDLNLNDFMIVDNELLKKEFVIWYLNVYYKKKINILSQKNLYYKIEIIDHNVNKISLFPENFIIIHKNNYTICNYNKS